MRTYCPNYLEKEAYKRVVSVARSYNDDLRKIKKIENDYNYFPKSQTGFLEKSNKVSDETFNITNQIDKHTNLLKIRTNSVSKVLSKFPDKEQKFLKQNVINGIPMNHCYFDKTERTGRTLRQKFITTLAAELGEII